MRPTPVRAAHGLGALAVSLAVVVLSLTGWEGGPDLRVTSATGRSTPASPTRRARRAVGSI